MKKAICLILAVFLLSAALTGCGGLMDPNDNANDGARQDPDYGNVSTSRDGTVNGRNHGDGLDDMVEQAADDVKDAVQGENRR